MQFNKGDMKVKKSMFKKVCAMALVGVMALSVVGCGKEKDSLDAIKEKKKLVVGLCGDYQPYEFHMDINGKDTIVGFDVEIAKELAKDLGVELEIKEMEFSSLVTAVPAGKIDMIISGMTPTEERKVAVDFSEIYYAAEQSVLVRKGEEGKYKDFASLEGKKIGAQMGSIQAGIAKDNIKNAEVVELGTVNDLLLQLKSGKVDAVIIETPVADLAAKSNPELTKSAIEYKDEEGGSAVAVKKGSPELLKQVNETLERLKSDGSLDKFIIDATNLAGQVN